VNADLRAVLLSGVWVVLVLGAAEWARRAGIARATSRKIVHIGIGTWIVPTYLLFETRWWAVAPALGFVLLNAASFRYGWIKSVESGERNVGTILYPASVALLLALTFGTHRAIGAAGVLAMTYGDAAASLLGRRWGRHRYHIAGHPRSYEGSLAMFGISWVAMLAAFAVLGPAPDGGVVLATAIAALLVTLLEAGSLWGVDNALVPLGGAACLYLLHGRVWG